MENVKVQKLQSIIDQVNTGMLVTLTDQADLRSRPMYTVDVDDEGNIWFFTSIDSPKVEEIISSRAVNLSYSSPTKNEYLSVSGMATLVTDEQKIKEYFTPVVKAWYPEGKQDPTLSLIKVIPYEAEYWEGSSSKVYNLFKIAKAVVTGEKFDSGKHGKL